MFILLKLQGDLRFLIEPMFTLGLPISTIICLQSSLLLTETNIVLLAAEAC